MDAKYLGPGGTRGLQLLSVVKRRRFFLFSPKFGGNRFVWRCVFFFLEFVFRLGFLELDQCLSLKKHDI